MHNLYLIESDNLLIIDQELSKILKDNNFNKEDLIRYDLSSHSIDEVINELDTYGLFQEKKIVLGYDATFLTTTKSEIEHNLQDFENYLNNPNPNNILIIACSKLDGKKNICKLVKEKCTSIDININPVDFIKERLKNYKISLSDINYLISLTGDDLNRINNELDKLMCYVDVEEITKKDIDRVVIPISDNNIFDLMDALVKKDKKRSLKLYNDLINNKVEVLKILINLSYQFRLMYQIKTLEKKSDEEIASIIGIKNPKQVRAIRYRLGNYTEKELLNNLHDLAVLDENIKTSKVVDTIAFPIYIANL